MSAYVPNQRFNGTVKWFSRVKGYGFITPEDNAKDIFVHYSAILGDGYRNLTEGEHVEYSLEETTKGLQATQVQPPLQAANPLVDTAQPASV